jgi:hypothetical protein
MIGQLIEIGGDLLDKVIPDKDKRREAKAKLAEMAQKGEMTRLSERMKTIRMEAGSEDAWTRRARPSFMYVVYLVLVVNCVVMPLCAIWAPEAVAKYHASIGNGFQAIPGEVWATFTAGYLGYSGLRTYEKGKGVAGKIKAAATS